MYGRGWESCKLCWTPATAKTLRRQMTSSRCTWFRFRQHDQKEKKKKKILELVLYPTCTHTSDISLCLNMTFRVQWALNIQNQSITACCVRFMSWLWWDLFPEALWWIQNLDTERAANSSKIFVRLGYHVLGWRRSPWYKPVCDTKFN